VQIFVSPLAAAGVWVWRTTESQAPPAAVAASAVFLRRYGNSPVSAYPGSCIRRSFTPTGFSR
jgi:hypothetical protein